MSAEGEGIMKRWNIVAACVGLTALVAAPALAKGPFDGSKPLLCAVTDSDICVEDGACVEGDAEDVRAPRFVRLDVKAKKIEILDAGREGEVTSVDRVVRSEGRLILQGVEEGRGWTLLVSENTGETTLSVSDDGGAFVTFGACTAL
jgi:hypothetical protein